MTALTWPVWPSRRASSTRSSGSPVKRTAGRFAEYLNALPFLEDLKAAKLWLDGRGPLPERFHPALQARGQMGPGPDLERGIFPIPETIPLEAEHRDEALEFLSRRGKLVSKLRSGRGGRGLRVIADEAGLDEALAAGEPRILQEWIDSRVGRFTFSIRAVAFAGRWVCAYANLAERAFSNHGTIAVVEEGDALRLADETFKTRRFDERSWEAGALVRPRTSRPISTTISTTTRRPETALLLPPPLFAAIRETAVRIERFYDSLDFAALPPGLVRRERPPGATLNRRFVLI